MKYTAEDGTVLVSQKNTEVTYSCATSLTDGVYTSEETEGSIESPFIKQIKIKRIVLDGICNYQISESTTDELNQYLEQIAINNTNSNI